MNLPWYGWRRWTCFVRSRSRSSASDQERSRSSVAYSDHVEADCETRELGARAEPRLRGAAQPALLLGRQHLERVAEPRASLLLDLDEPQHAAAPDDQVELAAGGPDV